jgi:hypothetical protein
MSRLVVERPAERDASKVADIHLEAMNENELLHAQFPSPEALNYLRRWLAEETVEHLQAPDKGVLVARDGESREIAGFVKWLICRGAQSQPPTVEEEWPSFCQAECLTAYADLTASVRKSVMGNDPYYRECLSWLETDAMIVSLAPEARRDQH